MTTTDIHWPFLGQDKLGAHLMTALAGGRLPGVMLFVGPAALGKATAARWLVNVDLCTADRERPCGQCRSCRLLAADQHEASHVLGEAKPEATITIEEVRAAIQSYTLAQWVSGTRWLIIRDAERLTENAANTMLKFLEELPPAVRVILTTAEPEVLPLTLRSRATTYIWHLVSMKTMSEYAVAQGWSRPAVARAAGRPGWLHQFARDEVMQTDQAEAISLAQALVDGSIPPIDAGREERATSVRRILSKEELVLREAMLYSAGVRTRQLWPTLDPKTRSALTRPMPTLTGRLAKMLDRHRYSSNIQPRLLYDDLHMD